jgi:hypothetical protein
MSNIENWITLGKEQYHLNGAMERWCAEYIGKGGWSFQTPKTWEGMEDKVWIMHSMFGNTTFTFKEPKHLSMFLLRWA